MIKLVLFLALLTGLPTARSQVVMKASDFFDDGNAGSTSTYAQRVGNVLINLIDDYTAEPTTFSKVTGVTDADIDRVIIRKKGSEYFKRNIDRAINVRWFGTIGNGVANDFVALQSAFNSAIKNKRHIYIPTGRYFCGFTTPLIIKGDGFTVEGDGSGTNANEGNASIIYGRVQIGGIAAKEHATRATFKDFSIFGPGIQNLDPPFTRHVGTGLIVLKGMECKFTNISIEGFKYGVDLYDTSDASALYAYSITFDHCRFFNNSVANFVWGRIGHSLNLENCNISYSDYNIVFGVFDKKADTIKYSNAEPNLTLNVRGCTIQGWRRTGILVTNGKKVAIRDNYFELGKPEATVSEAIRLGSEVAGSNFSPLQNGYEDNVMTPIVDGNLFSAQTKIFKYRRPFTCIRVVNVKKGSITNNLLSNQPYPITANDSQMKFTYLIKNDSARLSEGIFYAGNSALFSREITRTYVIKGGGYSSYHASYTFQYVNELPAFLNETDNIIIYKGVRYNTTLLKGTVNDKNSLWGMTKNDKVKFPEIAKEFDSVLQ